MSTWGISAADESQDAPVVTGRILALRARVQCGTIERRWNRFEGSIANVTADVPNFDFARGMKNDLSWTRKGPEAEGGLGLQSAGIGANRKYWYYHSSRLVSTLRGSGSRSCFCSFRTLYSESVYFQSLNLGSE